MRRLIPSKAGGRLWPLAMAMILVMIVVAGAGRARAADTATAGTKPAAPVPPKEVVFPGPVGQVVFPHAMHVDDVGASCTDCHHPVTAPKLETPHPQYFKECQVPCASCHHSGGEVHASHNCGSCHKEPGPSTSRVPSIKVAMHRTCGNCHDIGTGKDASASCSFCHKGPRTPW